MHPSHESAAAFEHEESESTQDALKSVMRFLRLMQRRKGVVGAFLLATFTIGIVYYCVATRYYESVAKLMVIQQTPDQVSTVGEQSGLDSVMASQRELVRTPKVIQAAIDRLRPEHRVDLLEVPSRYWVGNIASRLSSSTVRDTNHMEVRYQSRDPEAAAAVVSAIIDAYLEFVEKSHRTGAADVLDALTGERDNLNEELNKKQWQLQRFRQQIGHLALDPDSGVVEPVISRALHLNDALVDAQQRRVELQASLAMVQQAAAAGQDLRQHLGLVEEVIGQQMLMASLGVGPQDASLLSKQQERILSMEAELRRITPYLGPKHPKSIALAEQLQATRQFVSSYHSNAGKRFESMDSRELGPLLLSTLTQAVSQAAERERQLTASFDGARAEAVRQSGDLVQLQMLEREVQRIEKQHDVLFEKIATVDIHQVQAPIRVTTVQDPLPSSSPATPRLRNVLLASILSGLMFSALVIYLQDVLDDRFNSPEEMASQLGLPILALIRSLKPTGGTGLASLHAHASTEQTELEAFRTLRTAIALNGEVADRLAISSAEPSDGKTTISANLAVSFAQVGKKTLVIDADLRRPGMTALMELKGQPGVTDVLVAKGSVAELARKVVRPTGLDGLDIIPAGPRRSDSAELLAGENFVDLLAWADSRYDQVLIDCPPVLAVSDAQVVGRLVDGVVVVVSPEKNHRRLVVRACDSFRSAGVHVFGVVANRITDVSGYGYGYGYGYAYGEAADEEGVLSVDAGDPRDDDHRGPSQRAA